jgi:acyl transferase domain-containing protein/acyl-CoA synthetase (AMP-forming)/AMP-acid ligase II/acyl carrier protein
VDECQRLVAPFRRGLLSHVRPTGPSAPRTLADLLLNASASAGIRFIIGSDRESFHSYPDILAQATRLLGVLQRRGVRAGDEVVLALADPAAFIAGFWACVLGRMVPVPVQPPTNDEHRLKRERIMRLLHRPFLLADRVEGDVPGLSFAAARDEQSTPGEIDTGAGPDDIAFVQFSSGSTGEPKGVVLRHGHLVTHLFDFAVSAHMHAGDTFLSWFPLTHDMGLIGWHLIPLAVGAQQCLMPTRLFVQRPSLWLDKTATHRASVLCSNNFGIKHFLKLLRPEAAAGWDLSSVRLLFNAAEPISADLCRELQDRMEPHGLPRNAMFPGYGLAEASLGVAFPEPGEALRVHVIDRHHLSLGASVRPPATPRDAISLVEIGPPIEGVAIRIVDRDGTVLPDWHVGSVELNSRSMAGGYYDNPAANAALFAADGWLRTGDAGFLADGRLVLTGRIKEIIIQAGQNYYPQDLERLAEGVEGVELGRVVACGVPDPVAQRELLVLFVQTRGTDPDFPQLARRLRTQLLRKGGLLVDHVVPIASVPKTTSGKIERYKLVQRFLAGEFAAAVEALAAVTAADSQPADAWRPAKGAERRRLLLSLLQRGAQEVLDTETVALDRSLFEQGLDSRRVLSLHAWCVDTLGLALPVSLPFERPTLHDLAAFIEEQTAEAPASSAPAVRDPAPRPGTAEPIAIIGIGCRFPGGADRPDRFWSLLESGTSTAGPLPPDRGTPATPVVGCFLPDVAGFDQGFFQLSPREAEALDPQARLLLEVTWEALEDAGQDIPRLAGQEVGVFVGISNADYALAQLHSGVPDRVGPYAYTGSAPALAAGRIAHAFGLEGPAMAVDTACSSSLLAVHMAVESLRTGDCAMAVAGGVNLILAPPGYTSLNQLGALSSTGACRPFDDAADGYVRGEGCGVVVLKPLAAAQAAGDPILAVVLATAANHDGRSSGLTVPSGPAQSRVIRRALQRAAVDPADIDYLEAHGTGTPLGDPIEIRALDAVFAGRKARLPVGSVKSVIGHLESAAGIAGLIKATLVLRHGRIPPGRHLATPNRHLDWDRLAVRVPAAAEPLPPRDTPYRAGVSAFGFAGTNVHVVLQQAPAAADEDSVTGAGLMPVSANSAPALRALVRRWGAFAQAHPAVAPQTLAATTALRRSHLPYRAALRFADGAQLQQQLAALAAGEMAEGLAVGRRRPDRVARLGFVYTGQGAQWAGMGADLMARQPVFRAAVEACDALIAQHAGWSVAALLQQPDSAVEIARTDRAQPAIFAVQYALTALLAHYGIAPDCVVGHSVGEIAALHASGMLTLAQACRVVTERGRLMQDAAGQGAMLAVAATEAAVAPLVSDTVEIAAVNSPVGIVLAAPVAELAALTSALDIAGLPWQRLPVEFAFHSRQMTAPAVALADALSDLSPAPAQLPFYSTALGRRADAADLGPDYWQRNVRHAVRFADAVAAMRRDGTTHFVEIGPHPALQRSLAECLEGADSAATPIATLRRGQGEAALTQTLAALYVEGYDLHWDRLHTPPPVLTGAPLYPWQRTRFWQPGFDPWSETPAAAQSEPRPDPAQYEVRWQEIRAPSAAAPTRRIVVLAEATDTDAAAIAQGLGATLLPNHPDALRAALAGGAPPTDVLVLPDGVMQGAEPPAAQRAGLRCVLAAVTALGTAEGRPPRLWLVTRGAQAIPAIPGPVDRPAPDALWALLRSAATEHPELGCRRIDLSRQPTGDEIDLLRRVLAADLPAPELAIRGIAATTRFEAATLYAAQLDHASPMPAIRTLQVSRSATYLVTGGLGSLGLLFARFLLARGARTIVLLGRRGETAGSRATVAALTAGGARVLVRQADVTDEAALRGVLAEIDRDLPPLAGVVHAAGVLEDGMLAGLDRTDPLAGAFDRVLRPKLDGGWALHRATADRRLDFMLLLSSASLLLGSPGQGAYAAGNGFLDALARYRTGLGLPTLSLRLGMVAGSTMARRAEAAGRDVAGDGVFPMTEAQVVAAVPDLWAADTPTATLMAFRPADWLDRMASPNGRFWFAPLLPEQAAPVVSQAVPAARWGSGPRAIGALRAELTAIVAAVTGLDPAAIADDQPLRELGVDSLMTLKIRGEIARRIGCEVRVTAFWAHPTIAAFARHLADELAVQTPVDSAPVPLPLAEPAVDRWEKYL